MTAIEQLEFFARYDRSETGSRARALYRYVNSKRGLRKRHKAFRRAWRQFWRWFYEPRQMWARASRMFDAVPVLLLHAATESART